MKEQTDKDTNPNTKQGSQFTAIICIKIEKSGPIYEVFEDPIGLMAVPKADTLLKVIKYILTRFNLPLSKCRGQGYDAAANFQG